MRYLVSLVLALSGAAAVAADVQRWHLACTGGFDELDCLRMQDHSWDYAIPWDPWTPIGTSAHLMALSYALLAVAALGLAPAVVRAWWAWVVGVPFAAAFAVLAATTYESASAGRVVHLPGTVAALNVYSLAWPVGLLLVAVVGHLPLRSSLLTGRRVTIAAVLLALTAPLALYFVSSFAVLYGSHDTSPWDVAVGGLLTVAAAVALVTARRHVAEPEQPRRPVRTLV